MSSSNKGDFLMMRPACHDGSSYQPDGDTVVLREAAKAATVAFARKKTGPGDTRNPPSSCLHGLGVPLFWHDSGEGRRAGRTPRLNTQMEAV